MKYRKLSEQVAQISNPQRSDVFVREFRSAVREGRFDAVDGVGRFNLPKEYNRRDQSASKTKSVKEMIFEVSPAFEEWYNEVNSNLGQSRRSGRPKISIDSFENGSLDFKDMAAKVRDRMKDSQAKGQKLGNSRKKS